MKVAFMQRVDYWVGVPLCAVLSLLHLLLTPFRGRAEVTPQRILMIELSEMGSALLAYSSVMHLKKEFPNAAVYFLIFESNKESVSLLDLIEEENIITINDTSFLRFALSTLTTLFRINSLRIDTVLDLELFSRFTAILSFLSGARHRVGFHNYTDEGLYRGNFLTRKVLYNGNQHMALNFLALACALRDEHGAPYLKHDVRNLLLPLPQRSISESEKSLIHSLLGSDLVDGNKKLVLFNPDPGQLPLRGWPMASYTELARSLLERDPSIVVGVVGLPESSALASTIQGAVGSERVLNLTGKTANLRELLALLSFAKVLVTSDSGPAHVAALCSVHVVVLFGPESPLRYKPLSPRTHVMYAHYACSPCFSAANHRRSNCLDNRCLQAISVGEVLRAVHECISE